MKLRVSGTDETSRSASSPPLLEITARYALQSPHFTNAELESSTQLHIPVVCISMFTNLRSMANIMWGSSKYPKSYAREGAPVYADKGVIERASTAAVCSCKLLEVVVGVTHAGIV